MKRFLLYFGIIFVVVIASVGFLAPTEAQTEIVCTTPVNISNLAEDVSYIADIAISEEHVVWYGQGDTGRFVYHHNLTTNITEAISYPFTAINSDIFLSLADHRLVWSQPDGTGDDEIYYKNLDTGEVIQITDNVTDDEDPYIQGHIIAWFGEETPFYYDFNDQSIHQINHTFDDQWKRKPFVAGEDIVWATHDHIVKYNLNSETVSPLTDLQQGHFQVYDVDGTDVVWFAPDEGDDEIFMYDLSTDTLTQITHNSNYTDYLPVKDGDIIAWIGDVVSLDGVFMHNLVSGETLLVSERGDLASVSEYQIAWDQYDDNDREIMLYDVVTGETVQITNNDIDDVEAAIDQHRVVWNGEDGDYREIFYSECTSVPPTTATPTTTLSPTETQTPSATPTGTLTITPTISITDTPVPTATDDPTTIDLLQNGGFESKDGNNDPDLTPWTLKFGVKDKVVCNKPGKTVAHTGNCAFRFKGNPLENSKLDQSVDMSKLSLSAGDMLHLEAFVKSTNPTISSKVKGRVKYDDGTPKGKITLDAASTAGYILFYGDYEVASSAIASIKVRISNASTTGKIYIDDVRLTHAEAIDLLQLPD